MDKEFHYYITYILSRKSGFSEDEAYTIAYSSQYTDDNKYHYYVNHPDGDSFLNEISQTVDITKPSEKRRKIYPLFHFIPGGEEAEDISTLPFNEEKCCATIPNSENARAVIKAALASGDLYRIGIGLHALADTWSHQNFIGFKCKANARSGFGLIPNIGHADFFREPDKVHNEWVDNRLDEEHREIRNDERFLSAAREIFIHLYRFRNRGADDRQAAAQYAALELELQLKNAMDDTYFLGSDDKARIKAYKEICPELNLRQYQYDENDWRYAAVEKKEFESDIFDRYWAKENFEASDWYRFQMAVIAHREEASRNIDHIFDKAGLKE